MRNWAVMPTVVASLLLAAPAPGQDLRGHGGPVRAIAIAADGHVAMTGGFDQSVIRWRLDTGAAEAVLRLHEGSVNALVALPGGGFASAGEDGRIAVWTAAANAPLRVLAGHTGPVAALAVSPDGATLASAAWDGTVRLWPLAGGDARVLEGHHGNVNGVAFAPDGRVVSSGYDATLRIWPRDGLPIVRPLPAALNGLAVAPDGEIVVAGADGHLRMLGSDGTLRADLPVGPTPVIALALSHDGARIALGSIRGDVAIVDRRARTIVATLAGPGQPVWSLAFLPGDREILTGGADRVVRRWDAISGTRLGSAGPAAGEDPLAPFTGGRGAEVFRACAACHTLTREGGNRAGPTLHGIFGRRIASLPDYPYSPALRTLDIVWTPDTVARLFELGPSLYTPGTRMPEQKVTDPADREALVRFLEKATR